MSFTEINQTIQQQKASASHLHSCFYITPCSNIPFSISGLLQPTLLIPVPHFPLRQWLACDELTLQQLR